MLRFCCSGAVCGIFETKLLKLGRDCGSPLLKRLPLAYKFQAKVMWGPGVKAFLVSTAMLAGLSSYAMAADVPQRRGEVVQAQSEDQNWEAIFNTDLRYYSFRSTRSFPTPPNGSAFAGIRGSGSQFYVPYSLFVAGKPNPDVKLEFFVRSGYVDSQQTSGPIRGSFSGVTDTVFSTRATYYGFNGIQPFAGIGFNLPTGTTTLFGRSAFARLDADLVEISTFGQGFNVGPTIGANIPIRDNFVLTLSGGYTNVGSFNREGFVDPAFNVPFGNLDALLLGGGAAQRKIQVDPSDSASGQATVSFVDGPFFASLSGVYTAYLTTQRDDGLPILRRGDNIGGAANVTYNFTEDFSATVSGTITTFQADLIPGPFTNALFRQRPNINSTLTRIGLDTSYRLTPSLFVGPLASIRHRDRNSFRPETAEFVPANTRYGVGGRAQYAVTDRITVTGTFERVYIEEANKPDEFDVVTGAFFPGSGTRPQTAHGWFVGGGASARF